VCRKRWKCGENLEGGFRENKPAGALPNRKTQQKKAFTGKRIGSDRRRREGEACYQKEGDEQDPSAKRAEGLTTRQGKI